MVKSCAAFNCTSRWTKDSDISFHRFPLNDDNLKKKWISATKRKNFKPTNYSFLCSKHFTEVDYHLILPNTKLKRLKNEAIPTVFDFPSHLQQRPAKQRRILVRKELPVELPHELQCKAGTSISSIAPPVEQDLSQSPLNAATQEITLLPPNAPAQEISPQQTPAPDKLIRPALPSPMKVHLRRKVKILQQRLKRRDCKIRSMKGLVSVLRNKLKAPETLIEILENNFTGFPLELLLSNLKNKDKSKNKHTFSDKVKEFALTLYFYSPKAYRYLRASNLILPNPATLRKWIAKFDCRPGFLEEVFVYLKHNAKEQKHLQNVSLVFDSMSIRKQIIYDEKLGKNVGYVDIGGFKIDNEEEIATEALVFQIVSLRGNFKCVVGYFFVNKTSSILLSQLIKVAILKLSEVGVNVQSVTFDGTSTNLSALKHLGCKFPETPFFKLDTISYNICAILDPPHMLKLARNALADMKVIKSESGNICFKYIEELNNLQKQLGLKMCNKLSDKHVFYRNRKMNVEVAGQTLSSSVADALEYLCIKQHPEFINCSTTVEFIRVIDSLFDFLNSRDPYGRGFKGPIKLENKVKDDEMLNKAEQYLTKLEIENKPILDHARKTFALGFLSNIKSIRILRERLLALDDFSYLLAYKSRPFRIVFFLC